MLQLCNLFLIINKDISCFCFALNFVLHSYSFAGLSIVVWCFCERGLEAPLDLNLAFIIYDDYFGQPSSYVHFRSTSFDVGDHRVS